MNQEYISSLERIVHASRFSMVKADHQIKKLSQKQKLLNKIIKNIQEENKKLKHIINYEKEKYICNVCYQNQKDCIIEPCRHFVGCKSCSTQLNKCPICRGEIDSYITLFIP
jgi:hypothetical protein